MTRSLLAAQRRLAIVAAIAASVGCHHRTQAPLPEQVDGYACSAEMKSEPGRWRSVSRFWGRERVMQAWVGCHYTDMVEEVGPPDTESNLPEGRKSLLWTQPWSSNAPNYVFGGTNTFQHLCRKVYTTDSAGIIRKWSFSDCPGW